MKTSAVYCEKAGFPKHSQTFPKRLKPFPNRPSLFPKVGTVPKHFPSALDREKVLGSGLGSISKTSQNVVSSPKHFANPAKAVVQFANIPGRFPKPPHTGPSTTFRPESSRILPASFLFQTKCGPSHLKWFLSLLLLTLPLRSGSFLKPPHIGRSITFRAGSSQSLPISFLISLHFVATHYTHLMLPGRVFGNVQDGVGSQK